MRVDELINELHDMIADAKAVPLTGGKVMVDAEMGNDLICRSEFESPEVDGEIIVQGAAGTAQIGDFINVRILAASEYDLIAERILQ